MKTKLQSPTWYLKTKDQNPSKVDLHFREIFYQYCDFLLPIMFRPNKLRQILKAVSLKNSLQTKCLTDTKTIIQVDEHKEMLNAQSRHFLGTKLNHWARRTGIFTSVSLKY